MLDRNTPPVTYSPIDFDFKLPLCQEGKLDNGIPIYSLYGNVEPVLQLDLVFPAGQWYESQNGVAQATASLLKSGTSKYTSFQISDLFEQYGASVKSNAGSDWSTISISCLTKHIGQLLPLLADLITDTVFPQSEIDLYIQNAKQRLSVQLLKSEFVANRKIDEYLFGLQHPYGKYLVADDYDAITQDALTQHLKSHYRSADCKLFLAGSFSEEDIRLINQSFGGCAWNDNEKPTQVSPQIISATEKKYRVHNDAHVVQNEEGAQGSIRIASHFPDKHHTDFTPMIVVNTIFGGYFGSRLMANIREEKGYTYGIHSYMYNHKQCSAYLISTEAGKDVCEAAIKEIYHEMDVLKNEKVEADELDLVKNYLLGTILGDLDGAFQVIHRWKNLILNDFTQERFYKNIEIYKSITAEQIQALANKYYQEDSFYELVVT